MPLKFFLTAIFKMDNQQGPTIYDKELCSILCDSLDRRVVWGRMNTYICIAESLCSLPETITTLLTGYTPIQNKKYKYKTNKQAKHLFAILLLIYLFYYREGVSAKNLEK